MGACSYNIYRNYFYLNAILKAMFTKWCCSHVIKCEIGKEPDIFNAGMIKGIKGMNF